MYIKFVALSKAKPIKLLFKIHIIAGINLFFFLQISAQLSPGIEWRKSTHSPKGLNSQPQSFEQSGEEWWYSHKNVYNSSGNIIQYVTVGYTSLVSTINTFSAAQDFYNEGPNSPYNPITMAAFNYNVLDEGCSDRDYLGEHRTPARGNIGMNTLNGDMIYCKPKTIGALEEVIQDANDLNSFYVVGVHLGVRPYRNKTDFIPYNKTTSNPANYFSLSSLGVNNYSNNVSHLYVAKINIDGTVIWEGLYGYLDYNASPITAYESISYGYDLIQNSSGKLAVLGFGQVGSQAVSTGYPLLFEIDAANGNLIKKAYLPISGNGIAPTTNSISGYGYAGIGHAIQELNTSGNYAIAVTNYYANSTAKDNNNAYIWALDSNFTPLPSWQKNPVRIAGAGPGSYNSTIWDLKYHKQSNQLIVPVIRDCYNCASAGGSSGQGFIYRMDLNGNFVSTGINPSPVGAINAFDLRLGVEETSDGGFVCVSSTRPSGVDHSAATTEELGYLASCPDLDFQDWDTDALVIKYNSDGSTKWSKTFDTQDNRKRQAPPGDLKRQECLYKITEAQDGGFVICGNSSGNFDDFYMAKLYSDCNSQQTYTWGPNYVIDINENTTWSDSKNILGKVIIHPNAILNIDGSSTKIQFADSKKTGIETNITVMSGASLKLTNGSVISAIENSICIGSNWDGVIINPLEDEKPTLFVYPNPATGSFYIHYNNLTGNNVYYTVTDIFGKEVVNAIFKTGVINKCNTETLCDGVYFISLIKDNAVLERQKILIVK